MAEYMIVLLLMATGIMLLAVEMLVVPGFSIPGIAGIVVIAYGIFRAWSQYGVTGAAIAIGGGAILTAILVKIAIQTHTLRLFGLEYSHHNPPDSTFRATLSGKSGVAQTPLRPSGTALIDGKRVDVVTDGEFISPGTGITVTAVEGMRVIVTSVGSASTATTTLTTDNNITT